MFANFQAHQWHVTKDICLTKATKEIVILPLKATLKIILKLYFLAEKINFKFKQ